MSIETSPRVEIDTVRPVIAKRLSEIALIKAGLVDLSSQFVATSMGMIPMLESNADPIKNDLREIWGRAYPELFIELSYAHPEDFRDAATPEELEKGVPTRVWNGLGRFAGTEGNEAHQDLFFDNQTIDLDKLKVLYEFNQLADVPNFGPKSVSLVERVLENRFLLKKALLATSD